jgi:hypothetical protein
MIVGLTGLKGSGKDTVAAHLIKEYGFERRAIADKIKESAAALLGIEDPGVFETYKNDPDFVFGIGVRKEEGLFLLMEETTIRQFLQRYGDESHRGVFGNDFWVDQVLPIDGYYAERNIVITDVRFINEADRIHALKGTVVRVIRQPFNRHNDSHSSETEQLEINVDYEIDNTTMLSELGERIDALMNDLVLRQLNAI